MNLLDLVTNPLGVIDKGNKYTPNPGGMVTGLFQKRDGHPFVQGAARNLGHASFGNAIGDAVDQRFLGDPAPQGPMTTGTGGIQGGQLGTTSMPTMQVGGNSTQSNPLLQMMQLWMQEGGS